MDSFDCLFTAENLGKTHTQVPNDMSGVWGGGGVGGCKLFYHSIRGEWFAWGNWCRNKV